MSDYEKEEWWELYKTAVVELEHAKIAGRVHDARTAIVARVEKLKTLPGLHSEEHQAITDALHSLRVLDHEEAQYQSDQKQRAIDSALQRLKDIEPTIRRLTGEDQTT